MRTRKCGNSGTGNSEFFALEGRCQVTVRSYEHYITRLPCFESDRRAQYYSVKCEIFSLGILYTTNQKLILAYFGIFGCLANGNLEIIKVSFQLSRNSGDNGIEAGVVQDVSVHWIPRWPLLCFSSTTTVRSCHSGLAKEVIPARHRVEPRRVPPVRRRSGCGEKEARRFVQKVIDCKKINYVLSV